MADDNQAAIAIPGPTRFTLPSGQEFEVELLDFLEELSALANQHEQAGKKHADYLREVVRLLEARHNVHLSVDQADWLNDEIAALYSRKKKRD